MVSYDTQPKNWHLFHVSCAQSLKANAVVSQRHEKFYEDLKYEKFTDLSIYLQQNMSSFSKRKGTFQPFAYVTVVVFLFLT